MTSGFAFSSPERGSTTGGASGGRYQVTFELLLKVKVFRVSDQPALGSPELTECESVRDPKNHKVKVHGSERDLTNLGVQSGINWSAG